MNITYYIICLWSCIFVHILLIQIGFWRVQYCWRGFLDNVNTLSNLEGDLACGGGGVCINKSVSFTYLKKYCEGSTQTTTCIQYSSSLDFLYRLLFYLQFIFSYSFLSWWNSDQCWVTDQQNRNAAYLLLLYERVNMFQIWAYCMAFFIFLYFFLGLKASQ